MSEDPSGVITLGSGARRSAARGNRRTGHACARCGEQWTGLAVAHCGACHRTFSAVGLFDRHREHYGERGRCVDPATIEKGSPIVFRDGMWRGPEMTEELKAARFSR